MKTLEALERRLMISGVVSVTLVEKQGIEEMSGRFLYGL